MAASVIFAVLLKSISRQIGRGRLRLMLMRGVVWHPRYDVRFILIVLMKWK
jgi:hypothetical protein